MCGTVKDIAASVGIGKSQAQEDAEALAMEGIGMQREANEIARMQAEMSVEQWEWWQANILPKHEEEIQRIFSPEYEAQERTRAGVEVARGTGIGQQARRFEAGRMGLGPSEINQRGAGEAVAGASARAFAMDQAGRGVRSDRMGTLMPGMNMGNQAIAGVGNAGALMSGVGGQFGNTAGMYGNWGSNQLERMYRFGTDVGEKLPFSVPTTMAEGGPVLPAGAAQNTRDMAAEEGLRLEAANKAGGDEAGTMAEERKKRLYKPLQAISSEGVTAPGGIIPTPVYRSAAPMPQMPMPGMAEGGLVTGGDGTPDSVPAIVDGKELINLDSGEFVFPADVASHMGMGPLMKLVQKARQEMAEGFQPSPRRYTGAEGGQSQSGSPRRSMAA